ncbi:hypothetical protein MASR2M15_04250 [Anaerolineales bacterium]
MKSFYCRQAVLADIPLLRGIWYDRMVLIVQNTPMMHIHPHWSEQIEASLADMIMREDRVIFVIENQTEMIKGYISVGIENNLPGLAPGQIGFIDELCLDLHSEQAGLGKPLLTEAQNWLKAQGIALISVRIPAHQAVEQAFWRAIGAKKTHEWMWIRL